MLSAGKQDVEPVDAEGLARALYATAQEGGTGVNTGRDAATGSAIFSVATPIKQGGSVVGVVALTSAAGEIDRLVRFEREQVLQMFIIALFVSIGLSLVLASTIANPLSDLAAAAELGRDRNCAQDGAGPRAHPRPCRAAGRDRAAVGRHARHGGGALRPDRRERTVRGRRGARDQEPAGLPALGRRHACASPSATTSARSCWT